MDADTAALFRQYRRFLALGTARQRALITRLTPKTPVPNITPAQLAAFIAGDFDTTRLLTDYLALQPSDAVTLANDSQARAAFIALASGAAVDAGNDAGNDRGSDAPNDPGNDAPNDPGNDAANDAANGAISTAANSLWQAQARWLALPLAQRQMMARTFATARAAQLQLQADAKAVRAERDKQLAAAIKDLTDLVASQQAAMMSIKRQKQGLSDLREAAGIWPGRVTNLLGQTGGQAGQQFEADRLYPLIVADLKKTRIALYRQLEQSDDANSRYDPPTYDSLLITGTGTGSGAGNGAEDINGTDRLLALQLQAQRGALKIAAQNRALRWRTLNVLRANMRDMNGARLALIGQLSPKKANAITGIGAEGRAQARRELVQIGLELRFQLARFQYYSGSFADVLRANAAAALLIGLKILLLFGVFRIWRKYGDDVLLSIQENLRKSRSVSAFAVITTPIIRSIRKMRPPLDWLALVILLNWLDGTAYDWTGIGFAWLIASWILTGAVLVRLFDGIAARRAGDDSNQALRLKSLRLIAAAIVGFGLLLSLALYSVGAGTIYAYVKTISWLLLVPVIVLLCYWWRTQIFTLANARAENSPLLANIVRWLQGPFAIPATLLGGIVLFIGGVRMYFVRIASDIAVIRQVFDYSYRRKVVAQAGNIGQILNAAPLPPDLFDKFSPIVRGAEFFQIEGFRAPMGALEAQIALSCNRVCAIVGERGSGKSEFLRLLQASHDAERSIMLTIEDGGFAALHAALLKALGLRKGASLDKIDAALTVRDIDLICLENAHRLIKPKIGGLDDFDRLVELTQTSQAQTLWAISLGNIPWQFLKRARGDRVVFDYTQSIAPWGAHEIEGFIMARCAAAGIVPDFSRLDLPPQIDLDQNLSAAQRVRRDYFRFLTDQIRGNPSMALEYWRRSLIVSPKTGKIYVRIFIGPDTAMLETLPHSTLFVLRAALQMEVASEADIIACTDMSPVVVGEAVRALQGAGILERVGSDWRVTLFWYREVVNALQRRNLLTGS